METILIYTCGYLSPFLAVFIFVFYERVLKEYKARQ